MKEIKGENYEHGWQRYKLVCKSFISRYRFESIIIKAWALFGLQDFQRISKGT
jgi:hypothetical protein